MSAILLSAFVAAAPVPVPLDPPVVAQVLPAPSGGEAEAVLLYTNPDPRSAAPAPATVSATLRAGGREVPVTLALASPGVGAIVPAGGFLRARYRFAMPADAGLDAVLAVGEGGFAFATGGGTTRVAAAVPPVPAGEPVAARPVPPAAAARQAARGALLPNLAPYRPVYAVYGPGTDSAARIQLSFQYQLFGRIDRPTGDWKEGFAFAYTQQIFWDVERRSRPFRDVNYLPELFYRHDFVRPMMGAAVSVRGGILHDSNGRSGIESRSFQVVYVEPSAHFRLLGLDASVAPRLLQYVGKRADNSDIGRYRGHQSLAFAIGQEDGLKLATDARYNFGSGKGAVEGELSYPLTHVIGVPIYLVVQGFTGYGEDLRDYDRHQTRLRVGLGVVR